MDKVIEETPGVRDGELDPARSFVIDKLEVAPALAAYLTHRVTDYCNVLVRVNGRVL